MPGAHSRRRLPRVSSPVRARPASPADVERWLAELDLSPIQRIDHEGATSWDLDLDGRRRFDLRTTLILDPAVGLICWAHLAPPIGDGLRKAYRTLLRWNDEYPFAKFSVAEDGRPILAAELAAARLDQDEVGLALSRLIGIADQLLDETAPWLWIGGRIPDRYKDRVGRNEALIARYSDRLPELFGTPAEPAE